MVVSDIYKKKKDIKSYLLPIFSQGKAETLFSFFHIINTKRPAFTAEERVYKDKTEAPYPQLPKHFSEVHLFYTFDTCLTTQTDGPRFFTYIYTNRLAYFIASESKTHQYKLKNLHLLRL